MSARRSVPAGVQFITGVGGFASGLLVLGSLVMLYVLVSEGNLRLALEFVPVLLLGVGHLVSLYGLVRLRRWGYRWTRRLFAVTLLVNLPALRAGGPLRLGTVAFALFVLVYLWLAETSTFRRRVPAEPETGSRDEPGDDGGGGDQEPVSLDIHDPSEEPGPDADPLDVDPEPEEDDPDRSGADAETGPDADGEDDESDSADDAGQ